MNKEKTAGKKLSFCIGMHMTASALVITSGNTAGNDSWITLAAALGLSLLLAWLYSAILCMYPGKGLFDILSAVFGNLGGKIFSIVYVVYTLFLGAEVMRILNEFIQLVNLGQTPQLAILLFMVPLIVWQVRSGFRNIANCAKFLFPLLSSFILLTFLLGTKFMNPENLQPVLGSSPALLAQGAFGDLMIPLGEIVLAMVPFGEIDPQEKPFPILAKGLLMGGGILGVATLRNVLILGSRVNRMYPFSSYDAVNVISVGDFITSIAVLIGINLALAGVVKVSLCVYAASLGTAKVMGLKNGLQPAAPCCLLVAAIGFLLYDDLLTGLDFLAYIPFYSVPFQIIFPLVILIAGKVKQAGKKKRAAGRKPAAPPPRRQAAEE